MFNYIVNNLHKLLVPVVAVAALGFAIYNVVNAQQEPPIQPPFNAPAESPYDKVVAGSGITEARTENIAIGTALPGLVTEVKVKVGDVVRPGDLLFRIDDRAFRADLKVRQAMLAASQAQLNRLENMPRKEEVKPSEFRVSEAHSRVVQAQDRFARYEGLISDRAVSEQELVEARQGLSMAKAILNQLESQHELLMAGAWNEDKQVSQATVQEMQANLEKVQIEIDRLEVRAPEVKEVTRFKVLQVNVRPGEYVGAPATQALIVLGDIDQLHVRVDIDEHDIVRFNPQAKAVAKLRGSPKHEFPLTFVRVEPYVIPKRSLTGDNTERVDTRVLQVIYSLGKGEQPVYVGQQMDVFIQAD
ncbi:MAG TPA: HlyD family efflux transporter periplasmic adaptor subunit [Pirellulaceae bacterium]|nr:HlyD family efflux transporter periplasmic adaptor subunit [Pirellulaceae bacterium]